MPQQPDTTTLLRDLERVQKGLAQPGISEDVKATLERAEKRILALMNPVQDPAAAVPAKRSAAPRPAAAATPTLRVVAGGSGPLAELANDGTTWYDHQSRPQRGSGHYIQHPDRTEVLIHTGPPRVPRVTIDGVSLTEGQVRGQLTTHLRDLVESKYADEERWHDLKGYKTYKKAEACVAGMVAFFGPEFRWEYLQVPNGSKLKRFIFNLLLSDYWAAATVVWVESEAKREGQYTETAQIGPYEATVWGDGNRGAQMTLWARKNENLAPLRVRYTDLAAAKVEARKLVISHLQKQSQP